MTIVYSWKAEFSEDEKGRVKVCRQLNSTFTNPKEFDKLKDVNLIAEMANALDRYEAILNEMEKERHSE